MRTPRRERRHAAGAGPVFHTRGFGISDCDTVSVRIESRERDLTFSDVSVRISPHFNLELHLDTDEANAANVTNGDFAELFATTHP